jgi:hypothetical protein
LIPPSFPRILGFYELRTYGVLGSSISLRDAY